MDIFLKTQQIQVYNFFITWTRDMPGDAVMERKMYTAKKEIAGRCNSSTKEVDKAMFQT